jgi:hypothetical protein
VVLTATGTQFFPELKTEVAPVAGDLWADATTEPPTLMLAQSNPNSRGFLIRMSFSLDSDILCDKLAL